MGDVDDLSFVVLERIADIATRATDRGSSLPRNEAFAFDKLKSSSSCESGVLTAKLFLLLEAPICVFGRSCRWQSSIMVRELRS